MKPLFLFASFLACFCLIGCVSAQKARLQINYKQPYCGGARPSPEILQNAELAKPYSSKTVFIVSENGRSFSATTSSLGIIERKMKPGTYYLFEAWRFKKTTPDAAPLTDYELTCLQQEWKKPVGSFVVGLSKTTKDTGAVATFVIELPCPWQSPCLKDGKRHLPE